MATGGIFNIITNSGFQDKMIMNMDLLKDRIKQISSEGIVRLRSKYPGKSDTEIANSVLEWMPTMSAIEQTHIVFVNSVFKPYVSIAHEYNKTGPVGGHVELGKSFHFTMPVKGEFISDSVVHLRLENFYALDPSDKVRYCEFLGHRIMKNITFKINQVPIDTYDCERYNIHWQFKVDSNKELAYLRSIGQEIPNQAYLTGTPSVDEYRQYMYFGSGPQTFKEVQPTLDLWIPLLFWFKDTHSALPSFLIPFGQTDIEIELESESNIVAYADYGAPATGPVYNPPSITKCELYMNNVYIDKAMYKIYQARYKFQLVRITKTHIQKSIRNPDDTIWLQKLKYPIECMYIGFRPIVNYATSYTWYRNAICTEAEYKVPIVTPGDTLEYNVAIAVLETPVIELLGLKLYSNTLYDMNPPGFYNSYIPYQYGTVKSPRDIGWYMMNFNFYPGEFQPSGYINASVGRELYLSYKSASDTNGNTYIRANNPADLIVVADCINFMMFENRSAALKFST